MTLKTAKTFIIIFTIMLFLAAVYIGIRNVSYFDIVDVEVELVGPVSPNCTEIDRIVGPLKGLNIFEINFNQLRNQIKAIGAVDEVLIKKFYPGTIKIVINFIPYLSRVYYTHDDVTYYFLADKESLVEVDKAVYDLFSPLLAVELNPNYGFMVLKWGTDIGFSQMIELSSVLSNNTLINYAKYDNISSNEFGCMILDLSTVHSRLSVQDPVMPDRLLEVLNIIVRNYKETNSVQDYDLYSNALVKKVGVR